MMFLEFKWNSCPMIHFLFAQNLSLVGFEDISKAIVDMDAGLDLSFLQRYQH